MPLKELLPGSNPARDDVQQTDLAYDVVSRYVCNNWQEIVAAQGQGAYPFDVVVIGAGMFGGYCAEKLYRLGGRAALRIRRSTPALSCFSRTYKICRSSWAARLAVQIIRARETTRRARKTLSGGCPGSVTKPSRAGLLCRRKIAVLGRLVTAAHGCRPRQLAQRRVDLSQGSDGIRGHRTRNRHGDSDRFHH